MLAVECREPFGNRNGQRIQNKEDLCLTKIPSACVFIAFQLARVGRSRRLLTVKISRRLFNFLAGWSFGEAQLQCKLYSNTVGNKAVREIAAGKVHQQAE